MPLRPLLALLAAVLVVAAGCGSDTASDPASDDHAAHPATAGGHADHPTATAPEGGLVKPRRAAPPLRLRDVDGEVVDLAEMRGAPVLVTFVYSTCPDVCPVIMQTLGNARDAAGALGERTRVIAVSVDPEGDRPEVVRGFLRNRGVGDFVSYAIGERPELERVWSDWSVATDVPKNAPELIEHTALIYGVSASGKLVTAYPVGFEAEAVARDLKLLDDL